MGMPASSAVLNRFPGLQLKAWALFSSTGVLNASSGVASVVVAAGFVTVNLSSSVNGGVFVVDEELGGVHWSVAGATSAAVVYITTSDQAGAAMTLARPGYVAVYAP